MIQPHADEEDLPTFRRHYTRGEIEAKLLETRRRAAAPLLVVITDNEISDHKAIAVQVGREKIRLTPYMPSRECYIALHALALLPRVWNYEQEHKRMQAMQQQPKKTARRKR